MNDTGLYVYDMPTFTPVNSHNALIKKYKELTEGISKIKKDYYSDYLEIYDLADNLFYYDIKKDSLITADYYNKFIRRRKEEVSGIFFTYGEHPFLIFAHKIDDFYNKFTIPISDTHYLKKISELKFYQIKSVKLLSTKRFFYNKIFGRYKDGLIFAYKESAKPGSAIYISYADKNGQFKWNYSDTIIQKYLDDGKYLKHFKASVYGNKLILNIQSFPFLIYCMDIEKGTPLWYFHSSMLVQ